MKTSWNHFDISLRYYTVILAKIIFENAIRLSRGDGIKMPVARENCPRFPAFLEKFPEHKAQLVPRLCETRGWNDPARRYFMTRTRERGGTRTSEMIFGSGCGSHERKGSMHNDGGTGEHNERFIKINWQSGTLVRRPPAIKTLHI